MESTCSTFLAIRADTTQRENQPLFVFLNVGETHVPYWHEDADWERWPSPCVLWKKSMLSPWKSKASSWVPWVGGLPTCYFFDAFSPCTVLACSDHGDCWGEDDRSMESAIKQRLRCHYSWGFAESQFHSDVNLLLLPSRWIHTAGRQIMGRHVAGESFLKAALRHVTDSNLWIQVENKKHISIFESFARSCGRHEAIHSINRTTLGELRKPGCVYFPGPGIGEWAQHRSKFGDASWSICGITHTTASTFNQDDFSASSTRSTFKCLIHNQRMSFTVKREPSNK